MRKESRADELESFPWDHIDQLAVNQSRGIALDTLRLAGSGHPGVTLSLMPLIYLLYSRVLRVCPENPKWHGRDFLVLSCGHASLTQYIQLHLAGFDVTTNDIMQFRQLGSRTPGHPEHGVTPGIELSTGPLGQGFAMGVGLALANEYETRHMENEKLFRRYVYVVVSDGDTQEGVLAEAASLAGLYELSNLIVFYDSNRVTIDGSSDLSMSEDVGDKFRSMGWNVEEIPSHASGDLDVMKIWSAIHEAKKSRRPNLIVLRTTLGWPAPFSKGERQIHGNLLSDEETAETKKILGLMPNQVTDFSTEVRRQVAERIDHQRQINKAYDVERKLWFENNPHKFELWQSINQENLSSIRLPIISSETEIISTRKMNGIVIQSLKLQQSGCIGGSADLTESNGLPLDQLFLESKHLRVPGSNLTFGVREHAMAAITNGFSLYGLSIPYCATYLAFSDYQKPAVRLTALMNLFVTFIWTHDSVAIGADGPTHQPIDQLAMLRAIPNLAVVRPADAQELVKAWECILEKRKPTGLVLARQDLPVLHSNEITQEKVSMGAYILKDSFHPFEPDIIIIATGSEVHLAVEFHERYDSEAIGIRVVSMPCMEWFEEQSLEYKEHVLPSSCFLRISIEAGSTFGWDRYVGLKGFKIGIDHFGESGEGKMLLEKYGVSLGNLEAVASKLLSMNPGNSLKK